MAAKTGSWLIRIGCCIAFLGLCGLVAAFEPNRDKVLMGAGMMVLSTGMMMLSGGLYIKARISPETVPSGSALRTKRNRKANCDRCGKNEPVIQCRVHQVHLCSDCLSGHYDFRSCAYVPSTRRSTAKAVAYSQASGA